MVDISTTATPLKYKKNFPRSRHKFPGKRELSKSQFSSPNFPEGNTTEYNKGLICYVLCWEKFDPD